MFLIPIETINHIIFMASLKKLNLLRTMLIVSVIEYSQEETIVEVSDS